MTPRLEDATPYRVAGYELIPLNRHDAVDESGAERGKTPRDARWRTTEYNDADTATWMAEFGGNLGVRLRDVDLVIDFDPRNAADPDVVTNLCWEYGIDLDACPSVITGSGGRHYYLRLPAGTRVRGKLPEFPGIDFKSRGGQVVAAGSIHPNGNYYEWDPLSPPPEAAPLVPEDLLAALRKPDPNAEAGAPARLDPGHLLHLLQQLEVTDFAEHDRWFEIMQAVHYCSGGDPEMRAEFVKWSTADPKYAGDSEVITKRWDSLNASPTGPAIGAGTLFMYVTASGGNPNPPATLEFDAVDLDGEDDEIQIEHVRLNRDKQGRPLKTIANGIAAVDALGIEPAFDEFRNRIVLRGSLAVLQERYPRIGRIWTDETLHAVRHTLIEKWGLELTTNNCQDAATAVALQAKFNPLTQWLDGLTWDGVPRIGTWLIDYCGVEPSEYAKGVSELFLKGAVARAYEPGIPFQAMLVLEGLQGTMKSSALKALGGEYTLEGLPHKNPNDKDVIDAMQGYWIVEMEELSNISKADIESLKAFITRQTDRARLAYARNSQDFPRRCVFVGTTNQGTYLRDSTGNRRFLPVRVGVIDRDRLRKDRLQLWAEARDAWFKDPTPEAIELPRHLWALAAEEQEERRAQDPWEQLIAEYLDKLEGDTVSSHELLREACLVSPTEARQFEFVRIAEIMARFRWRKMKIRQGGRAVQGYRKEP